MTTAAAKKSATKKPKQPQDHKKKSDDDKSDEPFVWTAPDGRTVTFKPFGKLPSGMFRKSRNLDEMEQTFALMEAGTDEAGLAVLDDLPLEELDPVFYAWADHAGVELPES